MAFKVLYLLLFICLVFKIQCILSDSFFGTSYIKLPLEENTAVSEVSIRFRTSRTKGLLLYAFSQDSALVVRLRETKIEAVLFFGDDEVTLLSRRRPKLNNLRWHQVEVTLSGSQGILYIDGDQKDSESIPRNTIYAENIYVGGSNDLKSPHLSGVDKYFRGCLEDVTVGNINVIAASISTSGGVYHDITRECSVEFEAGIDDPISFVKETAFVSFPKWHIQEEGSFACWIRTSAPTGLLMFSYQDSNFIAAEIENGHIRVLVQTESSSTNSVAVLSEKSVNDMTWHFVIIDVAQDYIRISVDYDDEQFALSSPFEEHIDFLGTLYVGGVIHRGRSLAFSSDLSSITHASMGGSLKGCLRDIELNGVQFALGDSHATHGILVGCLYEFPCSLDPCGENSRCMETGLSDYNCECLGDACPTSPMIKPTSGGIVTTAAAASTTTETITTSEPTTPEPTTTTFQILTVDALSVMEGGGALMTTVNIRLNVNLREYNLRQSQVLFKMAQYPEFGVIEKDVLRKGSSRVQFTFLDLQTGKISYVHDGSENFKDQVIFDVVFSGKQDPVPGITEDFNFTLPIRITPVNDPPEIAVAGDNTFRMIRDTRRVLRADFLQVIDPDNLPSDLIITIVSQQGNVGYFEHGGNRGESITEFTQEDIDEGSIAYVHTGPLPKSRIVLRAADDEAKSGLASFRIESAELALEVANLTAVRTNPSASQIINLSNLNVITNDPEDMFEVTYQITTPPRLGEVQKLYLSGEWADSNEFSQSDMIMNHVRYSASRATEETEVSYDQIGITARSETVNKPGIFLPIQIVVTSVEVTTNTGMVLDVINEGFITSQNLSSEATHVLDGSPILYQVVRPPVKGDIMKHLVGKIAESQTFSQDDIDAGLITYRLKNNFYTAFNDTFIFRVTVSNAQTSAKEFMVTYFPDSQQVAVTNNGFVVQEGGSHTLVASDLFLESSATSDFSYTITSSPLHGRLQMIDPAPGSIVIQNVSSFLNLDITRGALQYVHDDSETLYDYFDVNASASFNDRFGRRKQANWMGRINISVELQNDNTPKRVIDKVFNVIKNGRTVLTGEDILYTDEDSDFDDDDLIYTRQKINAGDLVKTNNPSESLLKFSQRDLLAGKVTFKHQGDVEQTRMLFLVLDKNRKHYVAGFLQIQAIESHVSVAVNTGLQVAKGEDEIITSANLTAETNVNVKARNIDFQVTSGPMYGVLKAEGVAIQQFTQESLDSGAVSYHHNNQSSDVVDSFNFTVSTKGLESQGEFVIRILVASKEQLPTVEKMEPVLMEVGKEVVFTKLNLKISHPNHLATEIVYRVISPPKYGELRLKNEYGIIIKRSPPLEEESERKRRETVDSAMTFTQQDVSRGHVSYIQTDYSQLIDEFSFEVGNGYVILQNLTMTIDIAPAIVPLDAHDFSVLEERSKTITKDIIRVGHPLYEPLHFSVHILKSPLHGIIENTRQPGVNLKSFTTQDIENEFIYYVHDGSEQARDRFTIMFNNSEGKQSDAHTINITIIQINDQPPTVDVNEGLAAIMGALTPITNASLSASDPDTPDTNLTYTITNPGNGMLVYWRSKEESILSFSQADINTRDVLFVHQGSRTGGFRFQVTDGVHTTQQQIFSIRASPLLLVLANNSQLTVTQGTIQPLTMEHLLVVTNGDPPTDLSRPITYVITTNPVSGEIVKILSRGSAAADTLSYSTISVFTQEDIDNGLIAFKHDNSSTLSEDSFQLNVFLPLSQNLSNIIFELHIPFEASPTTPLPTSTTMSVPNVTMSIEEDSGIINTGVEVSEGESVTITAYNLDANILLEGLSGYVQYTVTKAPKHGFLSLSGRNITTGGSFIHNEMSTQELVYTHDHSDTLSDSFNFSASIKLFGPAAASAEGAITPSAEGIFKVKVLPVNDQTFVVVTASLRMSIVQGEHVVFNDHFLNISDPDNPPSDLEYKIIQGPTNGKIVFIDNPGVSVKTFTQDNINRDLLQFIHDGGSTLGAFTFRINDGKHYQIKQFFIDVVPRDLTLTAVAPLVLTQGDSMAILSFEHLNISSNGNASTSYYNITSPASFGEIRMNTVPVVQFTQSDIELGMVEYHQTDMASDQDNLQLTLFDDYNVIPGIYLNITVEPLIDINSIEASSGSDAPIMKSNLDATLLANKTGKLPFFTILEAAEFGLVVNTTSDEELHKFYFHDLDKGDIVYRAERLDIAENDTVGDNIALLLQTEGSQPVSVIVGVVIGPAVIESTTQLSTTTEATVRINTFDRGELPIDKPFEDDGLTTESTSLEGGGPSAKAVDNKGSSSIIYIALSIVAFFVIIVISIIIFILWRRRHRKKGDEKPVPPPPIQENLPETVTSAPVIAPEPSQPSQATPSERSYDSSAVTQPMIRRPIQSPMVPQVKVTPLGRPPSPVNSYASLTSNGTFQSFSNWTGCDPKMAAPHQTRSKSPTLKKSQYWV
ncbi:chondroitin sulfate proteoglycan 4-like [Lytechinus pictus]|uniref:chondroitin sulfate proteoglycan 4-like n=1 Tax=Lytechinus pictus TaxID=7653 RepID=UPI0030BA0325